VYFMVMSFLLNQRTKLGIDGTTIEVFGPAFERGVELIDGVPKRVAVPMIWRIVVWSSLSAGGRGRWRRWPSRPGGRSADQTRLQIGPKRRDNSSGGAARLPPVHTG